MLRLYRGDSSPIDEFSFHKTYKGCLFGQGIYLTDSPRVANSYRTKGSIKEDLSVLFDGTAANRLEAYEKAQKLHSKLDVLALVADGHVTSKYAAYDKRASVQRIIVSYDNAPPVGFRTEFHFDENDLNPRILDLRRLYIPKDFWDIAEDLNLELIRPDKPKSYTSRLHLRLNINPGLGSKQITGLSTKDARRVRNFYTKLGKLGIRHDGGLNVGGYGRHNAYVMWDAEYVNAHKVNRLHV